jgi:hypothetical protein
MGLVARPVVEHKGYGMRERERDRQKTLRSSRLARCQRS